MEVKTNCLICGAETDSSLCDACLALLALEGCLLTIYNLTNNPHYKKAAEETRRKLEARRKKPKTLELSGVGGKTNDQSN